jgi:hypothetical protein
MFAPKITIKSKIPPNLPLIKGGAFTPSFEKGGLGRILLLMLL